MMREVKILCSATASFLLSTAMVVGPAALAKEVAPTVEGAWIRLPSATGRPAGGYLVVKGGSAADALVAVSTPKAERVELHSMTMYDGVMRMRAEKSLAVPAKGTLAFAPGGNHLMLFGLDPSVKAGDRLPLTFTFQSGAKVSAVADVRPVTAPAKAPEAGHQH